VKAVVEVSVRRAAVTREAASASATSSLPRLVTHSNCYDASEWRALDIQSVHCVLDVHLSTVNNASNTEPTSAPCPLSEAGIQAAIQLITSLVAHAEEEERQDEERREEEEQRLQKEAEKKKTDADAAAADSTVARQIPPPTLPPVPQRCILLHDVYGFNLSGFIACCYLIESCGMDVTSAVNAVADARPPGIYSRQLLQALMNRYWKLEQAEATAAGDEEEGEQMQPQPTPIIPPLPMPEWHQLPWTATVRHHLPKLDKDPTETPIQNGVQHQQQTPTTTTDSAMAAAMDAASSAAAAVSAASEEAPVKRKVRKRPGATAAAAPPTIAGSTPATASPAVSPPVAQLPAVDMRDGIDNRVKRARIDYANSTASSDRPRSPQPILQATTATPTYTAPTTPSIDVAQLRRDHPFLVPMNQTQIDRLTATLHTLLPSVSVSALKAPADIWSFLSPPSLTPAHLSTVRHAISSAANSSTPPPYVVSWLPQHYSCFLLIMREAVHVIFGPQNWFIIPGMRFPKRKAQHENVNNTLLLGELILDPAPSPSPSSSSSPSFISRFLVCDLLVMSQTVLAQSPTRHRLDQRLQTMEHELIQPLKASQQTLQMHVRVKQMLGLHKIEAAMRMQVPHKHLGIVLQRSGHAEETINAPYRINYLKNAKDKVNENELLQLAQLQPAKR